ncbi:MAG: hypothetical protein PHV68_06715, partial [Candidatus Gastranaerophilales bacterium]|nr:hypothetical protein [Candidatus Gastranaerophilales bacterium]
GIDIKEINDIDSVEPIINNRLNLIKKEYPDLAQSIDTAKQNIKKKSETERKIEDLKTQLEKIYTKKPDIDLTIEELKIKIKLQQKNLEAAIKPYNTFEEFEDYRNQRLKQSNNTSNKKMQAIENKYKKANKINEEVNALKATLAPLKTINYLESELEKENQNLVKINSDAEKIDNMIQKREEQKILQNAISNIRYIEKSRKLIQDLSDKHNIQDDNELNNESLNTALTKTSIIAREISVSQKKAGMDEDKAHIPLDMEIAPHVKKWCSAKPDEWLEVVNCVENNTEINQEGTFFRVLNNTADLLKQISIIADELSTSSNNKINKEKMTNLSQNAATALKMIKKPPVVD